MGGSDGIPGHSDMNRRTRDVAVTCWCEKTVVHVPWSVIDEGRTESCGAWFCYEGCPPFETGRANGQRKSRHPMSRRPRHASLDESLSRGNPQP